MKGHSLRDALRRRRQSLLNPAPINVPTGIAPLDRAGMVRRGVPTVIGGHSGDGKSVIRKQLAVGAAKAGMYVQEYVLEDPEELVVDRVLADEMGVDSLALARGEIENADECIQFVVEEESWADNIYMDCTSHSPDSMFAAIEERWVGPNGRPTDLVLVDYVQLFEGDQDNEGLERIVRGVAKRASELAKRTNCGVVLFSQVKQDCLARGQRLFDNARWQANKHNSKLGESALIGFQPQEMDLQWSSALKNYGKHVITIFRPGRWAAKMGVPHMIEDNVMDIWVAKGNFGPEVGRIRLGFDPKTSRLWERA